MADHRGTTGGANRVQPGPDHADSFGDGEATPGSRRAVLSREKEEHGGIKLGSAFFGWLTAMGMAVLLTALAAAAGAAVGVATGTEVGQAADAAQAQADTVGLVGGIVLLVVLFVAYYCGGYVAGRMARFNGLKQGLAVWLWAIAIALVVAAVGALAGAEFNVLKELNSFPRLPVDEGTLTTGGVIALVVAVVVTLGGALLGGLAGMRFHRAVDKTGLGH
ncbi:hypothetical protein [Nocardioides sp. LHG3406-4]|uniref:hypothetical protein n=1 Tax=Nocardioides sp. LHG3406-4 TaxID=2804575 RepID=UPI003CF69A4E